MDAGEIMNVLGEPMRYRIWNCLLERKHCVRSLSKKMGISESAVSQHLKIMREAGIVYGEKYGYHTHYLPKQDAIDLLYCTVKAMRERSLSLNRDTGTCQCEFREVKGE